MTAALSESAAAVASFTRRQTATFSPASARAACTAPIPRVSRTSTSYIWPAPGSEDPELGVLMELEVGHGETEVYSRVQA